MLTDVLRSLGGFRSLKILGHGLPGEMKLPGNASKGPPFSFVQLTDKLNIGHRNHSCYLRSMKLARWPHFMVPDGMMAVPFQLATAVGLWSPFTRP